MLRLISEDVKQEDDTGLKWKWKKKINDNILKCDKASYTYGIVFPIYRPLGDFNTGCLISQPRLQKKMWHVWEKNSIMKWENNLILTALSDWS